MSLSPRRGRARAVVAIVRPFHALRPEPAAAAAVAAVPYDVVSTDEARDLAAGNPLSFLRVPRSEIELADDLNPYSDEVYAHARKNLEKLAAEAPLVTEDVDSYYLYAMTMNGKTQYGIALAASVDDYDNDVILKHEKTRRQKEDDRTNHVIVTEAHTGPVLLTCRPSAELNALMAEVATSDSLLDVTPDDGLNYLQIPERVGRIGLRGVGKGAHDVGQRIHLPHLRQHLGIEAPGLARRVGKTIDVAVTPLAGTLLVQGGTRR